MIAAPAPTTPPGSSDVAFDDAACGPSERALRELPAVAALICEAAAAVLKTPGLELTWTRQSGRHEATVSAHSRSWDDHVLLAEVPLLGADGSSFGAIHVFDPAPRQLSAAQRAALLALGRQAAAQLALSEELTAAHSLFDSEQMVPRNTFEQAPIGIAYANRKGRFLLCNPAFCRMLGYGTDELVGISIGQVTHAEDFGLNAAEIERLWLGEIDAYSLEKRYVRKDGSPMWVRVTASLVRNTNGAPQCSVGFLEDISERKQMESALQQSKKLLETVITDAPLAILACDAAGRIFMSNPVAVDLFGIVAAAASAPDASAPYPFSVAVFQPDGVTPVPHADRPLARALRGQTVSNEEFMVAPRAGRLQATLVSARQLLGPDGSCLGAVLVAQDITERKESEIESERVHKQLLDASRLAGMAEVASNVLHNVGNVLTSVTVSASLVAECVKDTKLAGLGRAAALLKEREADLAAFITTDERGRKLPAYLAQLAEQLQGSQRLALKELGSLRDNIEHIKETVAMQQGYAKLCGVAETVTVASLVEDSLRMNVGALTRHGVTVRREIADVPPITVDKHRILQILVNLIRNAKYACDESGRQDKVVTIRVEADERSVRISVIDNGVGIQPENMTRLFRHGFTTRKTGHGFGLHSGALAAKELGGSLSAYSDGPGCGACFVLELPRGAGDD
ncbi:MAG TPA: PAS domain S-box protein [Steroidobacteraceae bacterium]